ADIKRGGGVSGVWIIPLLALGLGAYMVVHNLMTQGPEIEIAFKTAAGLEQGKTKVKFRDVDMGVVEQVQLNEALDGVIATVKLDRQATPLLREDSVFWVVTARVGVDNISGLDTLVSGAYIQLSPGKGQEGARSFVGLDAPPLTPTDADGLRLQLVSERAASVSAGDAVLYKGYKVGRVEAMEFDPERSVARYNIFIDAPYHDLVNSAVRFWDASGFSLSAGADGFKVETGSIETVLLGGIAFGVPDGVREGDPVQDDAEFRLYPSYEDILKNPFRYGMYYVLQFGQSVKGLQPGAPVEYRGIQIGRVERLLLEESMPVAMEAGSFSNEAQIPVLIYVEPARIALPDRSSSLDLLRGAINQGIEKGLRASLESGSLLTGAKYVNFDYFPDAEPATLGDFLEFQTIPTVDTGLGQLQQKITSILNTVDKLPLDETVASANAAIASLDAALGSLNGLLEGPGTQALPGELERTLESLRNTLDAFTPDSEVYRSISSSLLKLNRTLDNLESVSGTLATQPSAVLLPGTPSPDPVPEAQK
ncbi:MAG: intermembrane transport protein PqiB, partial [Halioglobus sp.]|nr:intermembrane transport protein PqiB [Halioglobus sp.]